MSPRPQRRRALMAAALPVLVMGAAALPAAAPAAEAAPTMEAPAPAVEGLDPVQAGLSGPVGDVLEDAPERGEVRLVVTATDAEGGLEVTSRVAADRGEAAEVVRAARADDATLTVGVDHRVALAASGAATPVTPTTARLGAAAQATDPGRAEQWALTVLGAEAVWGRSTGAGTVVAVVDSGVDASHPDLAAALVRGFDFVEGGDGGTDPNGHGTHVAGIIAAVANNGIGVAGLAPGARVMPVRALDRAGEGWTSDVADGVRFAADNGADVVNLSLGSTERSSALTAAIEYARTSGVVVVAAVGNSADPCGRYSWTDCGNPVLFPGADEGVVGVGASRSDNARASFSEYGPQVDVVAPGVDILSTYPQCVWNANAQASTCFTGRWYARLDGTSMASPHVAATAALILSENPSSTVSEVEALLTSTAKDLGTAGRDNQFGHGLVQPGSAVPGAATPPSDPTPSNLTPSDPTPSDPTPAPPAATTTKLWLNDRTVHAGTYVTATVSVAAGARRVSGPASVCVKEVADRTARCTTVHVEEGRGSHRFRASFGSTVTAAFRGTTTDLRSTSKAVRVYVTPRVTGTGGYRRLTFQVSAAQRQRAAVQRYTRGQWRTVRTVTVTGTGRITVSRLQPGSYRVAVPRSKELEPARSGSLRVR